MQGCFPPANGQFEPSRRGSFSPRDAHIRMSSRDEYRWFVLFVLLGAVVMLILKSVVLGSRPDSANEIIPIDNSSGSFHFSRQLATTARYRAIRLAAFYPKARQAAFRAAALRDLTCMAA